MTAILCPFARSAIQGLQQKKAADGIIKAALYERLYVIVDDPVSILTNHQMCIHLRQP